MNDDISFENIEGTEDDEIDPQTANNNDGSVRSGGDPDNTDLTQDTTNENS